MTLPEELVDFFFNNKEKVFTKEEMEEELKMSMENNEETFKQAVCTGADGKISYITCHLFFEDLAKIETVLPKKRAPLECFKEIKKSPPSPKFGIFEEEEDMKKMEVELKDQLIKPEVEPQDQQKYELTKD